MNTPLLSDIDEKNAPWNEKENNEVPFDVFVSQTLVKHDSLLTSDYIEEDYGLDEDGYRDYEYNTEDVDWDAEYEEQRFDIKHLLMELEMRLRNELEELKDSDNKKKRHLKILLESCIGWDIEDSCVELDR